MRRPGRVGVERHDRGDACRRRGSAASKKRRHVDARRCAASAREQRRGDRGRSHARYGVARSSPTASSPSPSTTASRKGASGSGLKAHGPPAITSGSSAPRSRGAQRDAAELEHGEQVRVGELVLQAEADDVEVARAARWLSSETSGRPRRAQQRLHVEPRRVDALGGDVGAAVQDVVEDLQPEVRLRDLVDLGKARARSAAATGAGSLRTAPRSLPR